MNLPISVTQNELFEILLNVAPTRPVFIWGAPGIGKSALVEKFAERRKTMAQNPFLRKRANGQNKWMPLWILPRMY